MFRGRTKLVDGEALGVYHASSFAREHGWPTVVVERDCLQVVNHLLKSTRSLSSFGAIIESCP